MNEPIDTGAVAPEHEHRFVSCCYSSAGPEFCDYVCEICGEVR